MQKLDHHEDPRIRFLKELRPGEPTLLAAIPQNDGAPVSHWYRPGGEAATLKWLDTMNGGEKRHNVYFQPNKVREDFTGDKPKVEDFERIDFAHFDWDVPKNKQQSFLSQPDEARQKAFAKGLGDLLSYAEKVFFPHSGPMPQPTMRWETGGGVQGLYRLAAPPDREEAEALNKALIAAGGRWGDPGTWNIDRLCRIPRTTNWPNAAKRAQGRGPISAGAPHGSGRPVDPTELAERAARAAEKAPGGKPKASARGSGEPRRGSGQGAGSSSPVDHPLTAPFNEADMPILVGDPVEDFAGFDLADRTLALMANGTEALTPEELAAKADSADASGSGLFFEIMCAWARAGVPVALAVAACEHEMYAPGRYVLRKGIKRDSLLRQFANAVDRIVADGDWTPARAAKADPDGPDFMVDKKGNPYNDQQHNIREAIRSLGVSLSFDEFANTLRIDGFPGHGPALDDGARDDLWLKIDATWGFKPHMGLWEKMVPSLCRERTYHPVRDYLDNLPGWDGVPRVDAWLIDYGGADDTEFNRAVGALTLIAAVRRVRSPGCKFDEMLVLEGETGVGKSSAIAALCPDKRWFSDNVHFGLRDRETLEQVLGRWIIEVPELKGMRKSEADSRKAFLSRDTDRGRLAYAKSPTEVPRTCIFVGTTNDETYLNDPTGNRRFWPVRVRAFDLDALARDRDQLWAEAAEREAAGESIRLAPRLYPLAVTEQKRREVRNAVIEQLEDVLGESEGRITAEELRRLFGLEASSRSADQALYNQIGAAMKELGWARTKLRHCGKVVNCYVKGTSQAWLYLDKSGDDWFLGKGEGVL